MEKKKGAGAAAAGTGSSIGMDDDDDMVTGNVAPGGNANQGGKADEEAAADGVSWGSAWALPVCFVGSCRVQCLNGSPSFSFSCCAVHVVMHVVVHIFVVVVCAR
jgi:hypothetical protein